MEFQDSIPVGITREDVERAIRQFDEDGKDDFRPASDCDLIHQGRRYPAEAILRLAASQRVGHMPEPGEISNSKDSEYVSVLTGLGFEISENETEHSSLPMGENNKALRLWLDLVASEEQRRQVAGIFAESIREAHDLNPAAWVVTMPEDGRTIRLNVGRIFSLTLRPSGFCVLLDRKAIDLTDARLASWNRPPDDSREFKSLPGCTWREGPLQEVLANWPLLRVPHLAAIRAAAQGVQASPYTRYHQPDLCRAIASSAGLALPESPRGSQVGFDPEDLVHLVKSRLPGWASFRDPAFEAEEVAYKQKAAEFAREMLGAKVLSGLIAAKDYQGFKDRLKQVAQKTNLLYLSTPTSGDLSILFSDSLDQAEFCRQMLSLLHGEADPADRLGTFLSFLEAQGLPSKWTFPTYFLFLLHPDSELFIKPTVIGSFLELIGPSDKLAKKPSAQEYRRIRDIARGLFDTLTAYAPRDMIDIQGLIWICGNTQVWKIAPGREGWQWDECRQEGFIAMGWDDMGDVVGLSREDFDKRVEVVVANRDDSTANGLNQLWTFIHDVKIGDQIVADRGTSEVLGLGTVTGQPFYAAGQRYSHRIPVQWHDTTPRAVNFAGWRRTLIKLSRLDLKAIWESAPLGAVPSLVSYWLFQANVNKYSLAEELKRLGPGGAENWMVSRYQEDIHTGDQVVLWQTGPEAGIYGTAEITGEPLEGEIPDWGGDPQQSKHGWQVPLRILKVLPKPLRKTRLLNDPILSGLTVIHSPQGTNYRVTAEQWNAIQKMTLAPDPDNLTPPPAEELTLEAIAEQTGLPLATLQSWVSAIRRKNQAIFYGPPGTGKTFVAELIARHLIGGDSGFCDLVQFHPAYTYEDFIQGLRPESGENGQLRYRLVPGRFLEFCRKAAERKGPCVLIIDEINRANLARVLGELMYLLEYRDKETPLAAGQTLSIPPNVFLIGTMNTADRSIALVDHALRRRFAFIALYPDFEPLRKFQQDRGCDASRLIEALTRLNRAIGDRHYEIGISFFMRKSLPAELPDIWQMEIEPYLEEYFFDQPSKVDEFRWAKIAPQVQP